MMRMTASKEFEYSIWKLSNRTKSYCREEVFSTDHEIFVIKSFCFCRRSINYFCNGLVGLNLLCRKRKNCMKSTHNQFSSVVQFPLWIQDHTATSATAKARMIEINLSQLLSIYEIRMFSSALFLLTRLFWPQPLISDWAWLE